MNKRLVAAMAMCALLGGCAGARVPKLAKCTGPARYANPYGSVLPTLPVSGEPAPAPTAPADASPPAGPPSAPPPASTPPPAGPSPTAPAPAKTSAILPYHPSC